MASTSIAPTGRMIGKVATPGLDLTPFVSSSTRAPSRPQPLRRCLALTAGLLGNAVTANVFMVGVAYQAGLLPVTAASIERGHRTERHGRRGQPPGLPLGPASGWSIPSGSSAQAGLRSGPSSSTEGLEDFDDDPELRGCSPSGWPSSIAYQNRAVRGALRRAWCGAAPRPSSDAGGDGSFTRMVARQLHHVMAYKDEYEVARLLLDGGDKVAAPSVTTPR